MADETLTMSTRVVGNTDMLESHLNDRELVMMDIDTGSYFGLDNVGKSIWGHLGQPRPVKEICDLVTEEFDVEGNRAAMENDVPRCGVVSIDSSCTGRSVTNGW